jgi:hypothetical protein
MILEWAAISKNPVTIQSHKRNLPLCYTFINDYAKADIIFACLP